MACWLWSGCPATSRGHCNASDPYLTPRFLDYEYRQRSQTSAFDSHKSDPLSTVQSGEARNLGTRCPKPSPALRKNDPPTHKWPHQRHRSPVRSARPRGLRAGDIARGPVLQRLPVLQGISMVGPPGFEPATSSLSGRSTRLPDQDLSADSACYQGLLLPATCMMLQRFPAPRGLFVDSEQHRTAHSPTERDRAPMRSHLARGGRS